MDSPKQSSRKRKKSPEVRKRKNSSSVKDHIETKEEETSMKEDKKEGRKEGESSPARCPICLAMPENKAKSEACSHYFCYSCLKEWSKVKAECPLCKMPIHTIYYNIRSDREFDEYHVKQPRNDNMHYVYDLNLYDDWWSIQMQQYRNEIRRRRENDAAAIEACSNISLIRRRRMYYWQKLKVSEVRTGNRVRDISAEFYRDNPSQIHRLVPWLKRELTVLYGAHNKLLIQKVRDIIISVVSNMDITSRSFYHLIQPYLLDHTEQFIHEFIAFARSPYDVRAYDRYAIYNTAYTTSHETLPRYEMTSSEGSDTRNRTSRNPLKSRWDDSPEEAGQMPSSQSLMLSQTSWNDDLGPTIYPDVNVLWPAVSLQGTRSRGIGPRDATPPSESANFRNPTPPRNYSATIADTAVTYSQLLGNVHPARRLARTIHYRSSDNVDVEAPLVHQTIFSHRSGTSSAYAWMEKVRRRYNESLFSSGSVKQKKSRSKTRWNQQQNPAIATTSQSGDVIIISSDSEENIPKSSRTSNPLFFSVGSSQKRKIKTEKSADSSSSDSSSNVSSHSSKDSDIEFVKYIKPPHLRTPDAYINLDSGSDCDRPGPSSRANKRSRTKPSVTSQLSSSTCSSSSDESDYSRRKNARKYSHDVTMDTEMTSSVPSSLHERDISPPVVKISSFKKTTAEDVSEEASSSQNNGGGLKKIFEKGKVSVSLNNGRNKYFDSSDSGSDIDVGVEDNRTMQPVLTNQIKSSSERPHGNRFGTGDLACQNSSISNISSSNHEDIWRNSELNSSESSNTNFDLLYSSSSHSQTHQNNSSNVRKTERTNESHPRTRSNEDEDVVDVQFIRQSSQSSTSSIRQRRDGRRSNDSRENLSERTASRKSHRHKGSKKKKRRDSHRSHQEEKGRISDVDEKRRREHHKSSHRHKKMKKSRRRSRSLSVELIPFH